MKDKELIIDLRSMFVPLILMLITVVVLAVLSNKPAIEPDPQKIVVDLTKDTVIVVNKGDIELPTVLMNGKKLPLKEH